VVLVDTSVWVEHLRGARPDLSARLEEDEVFCHPFVIGELACGAIRRRDEVLRLLRALPSVALSGHDEALAFLESSELHGLGLGWVDVHLLASARLSGLPLWTLDLALDRAARSLGLGPL